LEEQRKTKRIDEILEKRLRGYRSRGEFTASAIREYLKEFIDDLSPRFEHFNVYEDHVTIFDNENKRLIDVYFRAGQAYCEYDEAFDCEHIQFALSLPDVVNPLNERGWIIRDGKIISGPS